MKNLSKISLLFAIVLFFGFTSCGDKTYTVTFDSRGGSAVEPVTGLMPNSTVTEPAPPVKEGYAFEGWYRDTTLSVEWNFEADVVTSDITLYAKWDNGSGGADNGFKISATVEGGNEIDVDEVRAIGYILIPEDEDGYYTFGEEIVIASAPFTNGGFTITLPGDIDERLLVEMGELPDGLTVSNADVKSANAYRLAAYKNNELAGYFYYISENSAMQNYIFVNKDVRVTGSFTEDGDIFTYDATLKEGWNAVYMAETISGGIIITTTKPAVDFVWMYGGEPDVSPIEPPIEEFAPAKAPKKHSLFLFK
ncbi:MAG: InlB B-repeat-containing protein [Prevotellaceae bacterium]|jgi:uncharacterized repeat protein (TIGR02543 family)|nr:InlB B-repeat-containing protein [Prevotellaceae bacterium]